MTQETQERGGGEEEEEEEGTSPVCRNRGCPSKGRRYDL